MLLWKYTMLGLIFTAIIVGILAIVGLGAALGAAGAGALVLIIGIIYGLVVGAIGGGYRGFNKRYRLDTD